MIPFEEVADVYYVLAVSIWHFGVLEADQVAKALVARDCSDRWWSFEH